MTINKRSFFKKLALLTGVVSIFPFLGGKNETQPAQIMTVLQVWMPGDMSMPYLIIFHNHQLGRNGFKRYNVLHNDGYTLLKDGDFYCEPKNWDSIKKFRGTSNSV